jgi:hypothetical protein
MALSARGRALLNRAIHDPKSWPRAASVMASTQGWLMRRSIDIA